jgi:hypothetical protein
MATSDKINVDLTTGVGVLSFPHLTKEAADQNKNDKGVPIYDCQFLIPKSDRETAKAILAAIKKVGEAKWGDNWKKVRTPLRDGDKEKDELTEDGSTKGDKYPERLGHWFINARSQKPVAVVDRGRSPIIDVQGETYSGCKVKIAVSFYTYSVSGNHGVGVGLNGVQKIAEGEPIGGGGKPAVESMFDMLDESDDLGLDEDDLDADLGDEEVEAPAPAKKAAAKKAPAKKAAAKKAAAPIEVEDDEDDLLDDLDDLDADD